MTKKNVAALMLAGAMMTVGSGAMAVESAPISAASGSATVDATYTSVEKIDITVSWNKPEAFAFTWKDGAWAYDGAAKALVFSATNAGSKNKTVSLALDSVNSPAWITAGSKPDSTASNEVAKGTSAAQAVAEFELNVI